MKKEIKIPSMGESISEATIGEIMKPSGSLVAMDEELLELETDKVNQALYAPQQGLVTWQVKTGDTVKIGQVIGFVDSEGKVQEETMAPKTEEKKVQQKVEEPKKAEAKPKGAGARVSKEAAVEELVTAPIVQKEVEFGQGHGQGHGVSKKESRKKMTKIRQVIASRMLEAQQNTAMLTTFNEIDMSQVIAEREKYKEPFQKKYGVKLGFMSFFVKAVVDALKQFPELNSYIDGDEIVHREYYDIGIAVGTERGLVVPVVRNCDSLSYDEIEKAIEAYAKKAKEGGLSVDDLKGGGFTITNGGVYGSLLSTPIINPPQSGILGMHKIVKRPIAVDDQVVIRPMMYVALSYDHRIVDGKEAVSFLVSIKNWLEDPARMLLKI